MAGEGLTHKQRLFVEAYLGGANGNATEAARQAGYKDPEQAGYENKRKQEIQAAISARLDEAAMPANEVLARLADHARASLADFIEVTETGSWRLDLVKGEERSRLHLLTELSFTEHGPKIKTVDSQSALVHLGRKHGLFTDKTEHSGDVSVVGYSITPPAARPGDTDADGGD